MNTHHDDHGHHGPKSFWTKYVFSTDHKVIGIQFMFASLLFVILGGLLALGVRYQLAWPDQNVPYARLLPGRMTNEAPEQNIALWQTGVTVSLSRDVTFSEDDDQQEKQRTFPRGATARLKAFPQGFAVTVPAGTLVSSGNGAPRTLQEPLEAFIDPAQGIGDYNYMRQDLRVNAGATVRVPGQQDRQYTLLGTRVLVPDAGGARETISRNQVILPTRPAATEVVLADAAFDVTDQEQVESLPIDEDRKAAVLGQLAQIKRHNKPIQDKIDSLLNDAEEKKQAGDNKAADALISEAAQQRWSLQPEKVAVALNIDQPVPAGAITYTKDLLTSDAYLQLFTMHASIMIFMVIIPMLVGAFGNFLVPLMIGARDMAFPRLNALSFWLAVPAGIIMLISFWTPGGAAGGGWTMYPTLSEKLYSVNVGTTLWVVAVGLVGFSSIVGSINYITTTINMRAPGMSMFRMPLTVWSILITATLALFATPVLTAAMVLLLLDRTLGTMFFLPDKGGQPLMWQHLFWFYSHPAVYIMILPAMGVVSDVLSTFARKPIFGYKPMVFAMAAISGLGFIVWGHHMFQSGMNPVLGTTFMASTIMIAVPSAIKTFNWLGTLWGGNIRFTPAMLNALAFVSMFVIGGLSGIFMASAPVDIHIHDTYFIVAHIHYVLFGGSLFGIFAGIYHWFPKMFGRQLNQKWGTIHFIMTIIAFNGTFFLMHILGVGGAPRRYASHLEFPTLAHLQPMNVVMTIFALMMGMAQIPFFYNFFVSLPRKLGRAITAVFLVALGLPTFMGMAFWGNLPEVPGVLEAFNQPADGFTWTQALVGYALLLAALAGVGVWMVRGLEAGPRLTALLSVLGLAVVALLPTVMTPESETTIVLLQVVRSSAVVAGYGALVAAILIGAVFAIWAIGAAVRVPALLQRLLYVVFLPAFVAPALFKPDGYLWLGVPELYQYRWVLLALFALPGLVYLLVARPRDEFGYEPGTNPWHANSLEWVTTSPPPHTNFDKIPTVYRGPYEYSSPVVREDYLPQPAVLPAGVVEPAAH